FLFNERTSIYGKFLSRPDAELGDNPSYMVSDYIEIGAETDFTTKSFNRVAYYDINLKKLRMHDIVDKDNFNGKTRENEEYIRVHGLINDVVGLGQINIGNNLLEYEPYYLEIKDLKGVGSDEQVDKSFYFTPENLTGNFKASDNGDYVDGRINLQNLYTKFDDLLALENGYMSKNVLGKDESGEYDVVEYQLKPKQIKSDMPPLPKIIFVSNVHGEEKGGTFAVYHFIYELVKNWKDDPLLEYLRHHVEFAFIPVLNPWGFVNESYKNVNGVNIQVNL